MRASNSMDEYFFARPAKSPVTEWQFLQPPGPSKNALTAPGQLRGLRLHPLRGKTRRTARIVFVHFPPEPPADPIVARLAELPANVPPQSKSQAIPAPASSLPRAATARYLQP